MAYTLLLSAIFGGITVHRLGRELTSRLIHRGGALAAYLAEEARHTMQLPDSLNRYFGMIFLTSRIAVGDVIYAQVVADGEIQSQYSREPDIVLEVASSWPSDTHHERRRFQEWHYLDFMRPLPGNNGYVRLGISLESVDETIFQTLLLMATMTGIVLLLGLIIAVGLYTKAVKPIETTITSINRLAAGDVGSRLEIEGDPAVERLAQAFNEMVNTITERDQQLSERNHQLQEAYEAQSKFLAMISHELKTPLHTIRGTSQLLLSGLDHALTEQQKNDVEAILTAGNHLLALIENILKFNALGTETLHITSVSLRRLIDHSVNHVDLLAKEKGLSLVVGPVPDRYVSVDETKMRQVLINLLTNAVQYTEQGEVCVDVDAKDGELLIQVADSGHKIPPEERERVWRPFIRLIDGPSPHGLGLGLTIVRQYVEMHGGAVHIQDSPQGGTAVVIKIPDKASPAKTA